jgi:hypothetical protein
MFSAGTNLSVAAENEGTRPLFFVALSDIERYPALIINIFVR